MTFCIHTTNDDLRGYIQITLSVHTSVQVSFKRNVSLTNELILNKLCTQLQSTTWGCAWRRIIMVWNISREIMFSAGQGVSFCELIVLVNIGLSMCLLSICYLSVIHLLSICYLSVIYLFPICYLSVIHLLSICYLSVIYLLSICYQSVIHLLSICLHLKKRV